MKILATGDIHGDKRLATELAKKAQKEHADLVIIAGDFTEQDETRGVLGEFTNLGLKIALIPGNHDSMATTRFAAKAYNAQNLHGYGIIKNEIGIFGAGGANIGIEQLSEQELYEMLKKGYNQVKGTKKKIMVTHIHPSGTKMEQFTNFVPPSTGIRKAIEALKPDIAICSHVHEAEGIEEKIGNTRLINVGRAGKIIEL